MYALHADGRLYEWEPEKDRMALVARYAPLSLRRGTAIVIADTGELLLGQHGHDDPGQTRLLAYEPGQSEPVDLGNPAPGACYLTALALASDNTVYGLSTEYVYGLAGTPIHLYSASRA